MDEPVRNRVIFSIREGNSEESFAGKFYNLGHIPRMSEQVYLKGKKYLVINVCTTPKQNDGCDVDITLEPIN